MLGPPDSANNPFTQREIKDALWDAYFDTETVLDNLMKEAEKRNKKKTGEFGSSRKRSRLPAVLAICRVCPFGPLHRRALPCQQNYLVVFTYIVEEASGGTIEKSSD